ncbi:hypothetical protein [Saccharicrinis fermentans]|uniref:Uncharacterized protein n=1 Tax=Saccharicrinis fermentans DSM 9555 = JCM 21142 TaxID=869213 RepID=W7Y474_9BACT|nr:hypothetical protein [Saccharicrinis fermentans]GAF05670.1 hypothetical protein JCM21142_104415 [Saccharicrinis fermentans DSM 9555 = JCM 21142]
MRNIINILLFFAFASAIASGNDSIPPVVDLSVGEDSVPIQEKMSVESKDTIRINSL